MSLTIATRCALRLHLQSTALLCTLAISSTAGAQTFRGVVLDDSTKRPLESAMLTLLDSKGVDMGRAAVRSDSAGRFVLHAPAPGKYSLRVARIGYAPLKSVTVSFQGGEAVTMNLAMSAVLQRLGTVVVTDRRRLNGNELLSDLGFELRRSKGNGHFLDTLDLAVFTKHPLDETLQLYGGLGLTSGLQMINGISATGRFQICPPELWIDGFEAPDWRLLGILADETYGIEVFGHLQLPPISIGGWLGAGQAAVSRRNRCGLIVVWTKAYINDLKKKEKRSP